MTLTKENTIVGLVSLISNTNLFKINKIKKIKQKPFIFKSFLSFSEVYILLLDYNALSLGILKQSL